MGYWTEPRLIIYRNARYDDSFDYDGPACYELGTGGPRRGNIQWHYVGETSNELRRMCTYTRNGSHLSKKINWHLRQGWHIYYRARACSTKEDAKRMESNLLSRYEYDWNVQLNRKQISGKCFKNRPTNRSTRTCKGHHMPVSFFVEAVRKLIRIIFRK